VIVRTYDGLLVRLEDEQSARNFDLIVQKYEALKNIYGRLRQWAEEDRRSINALIGQSKALEHHMHELRILESTAKPGAQAESHPFPTRSSR